MPSVDNRVVRMEFDNAEFERRLGTTLTSLKKLETALKMEGAKKGLQDVHTEAGKLDKLNFAGAKKGLNDLNTATKEISVSSVSVSRGIEGVGKGFIAMSTVAITALSGITAAAIHGGAQVAKSFTLSPLMDGFREFETQMGSVQTILANTASKGTTLSQVTDALDTLNVYSDKTIYNFGQMAKNIGTFTAAGLSLETSTEAIKGIANLAAFSGSTADQASSAMYQLSQAMAAGKLSAVDWISVVNAGMAGEGFKTALFEAAKAVGDLADVPADQSFTEWTDAGNNFKESMSDGVFTADALTLALKTFTGDMSKADLVAAGFSDTVAEQFLKTGAIAVAAATEVKTFTQLISTIKESIGTGFADTFKIVIGSFEESKEFFTGIYNVVSTIVGRMAELRNNMLNVWKFVGGRNTLIEAFQQSLVNLYLILKPIREAFREVFPRTTGIELAEMTKRFRDFLKMLQPSQGTIDNLRRIFTGLFSILSIGMAVVRGVFKVFFSLVRLIAGGVGPGFLGALANVGDFFNALRKGLVEGGGIAAFFEGLVRSIGKLAPIIEKVKEFFARLFGGFDKKTANGVKDGVDGVGKGVEKVGDVFEKFEPLLGRFKDRFEVLKDVFQDIGSVLSTIGRAVGRVFSEIGEALAATFSGGNFDKLIDGLNIALGGGLLLLIRKFINQGLKIDFTGGLFDKIGKTFDALTSSLKALQLKVKAEAIMKIAKAIAVLVAALVVLSLIDSVALTKALIAMGTALGLLVGVLATLEKLDLKGQVMKNFIALAAGMFIIGGAMILMAAAARILGGMDWDEMIIGLSGLAGALAGLIIAVKNLQDFKEDLAKVAGSLILLGIAIFAISKSVSKFSDMEWEELGKGLTGFAASLGGVVVAMRNMPKDMEKRTKGLASFGLAINLIAFAVKQFAGMSIEEMIKGFAGFALVLGGLVIALKNMPSNMIAMAAEILAIGVALNLIGFAMKQLGGMGMGEIAAGIVALAGALIILAIASHAMNSALAGAAAILVVSAAMVVLGVALEALSHLGWKDLLEGLLKIAVALAVFSAVAYAIQASGALTALIGLGIALAAIGLGFALVGVGAKQVADAFYVFGKVGPKAFDNVREAIKLLITMLPTFFAGVGEGLILVVKMVLKAAPVLIKGLQKVLEALLDLVIKLIPKFQQVLGALIRAGAATIRTYASEYIKTGLFILLTFLQGIRDAIPQVVTVVGEIITGFLDALAEQIPQIIESIVNLLQEVLMAVARGTGELMATIGPIMAIAFFEGFLEGLEKSFGMVWDWFTALPGKILDLLKSLFGINSPATTFISIGTDLILGLLQGLVDTIGKVFTWFSELAGKILGYFTGAITWLVGVGGNIIQGLLNGITATWHVVTDWLLGLPKRITDYITDVVGKPLEWLSDIGGDIIQGLANGIEAGADVLKDVWNEIMDKIPFNLGDRFKIKSPSLLMAWYGEMITLGLAKGIDDGALEVEKSMTDLSNVMTEAFDPDVENIKLTFNRIIAQLSEMEEFNPVITPVLDLTRVAADAKLISDYIPGSISTATANTIAASEISRTNAEPENSPGAQFEKLFEQNIYAPEQLSMADIYRQTRNQIIMAKEELKIP